MAAAWSHVKGGFRPNADVAFTNLASAKPPINMPLHELHQPPQTTQSAECEASCAHHRPVRLSWDKLLKRVFEIDMEHCPNCGGDLKIIAAILEQSGIEKILTHLGLQACAPPRAPARGDGHAIWRSQVPRGVSEVFTSI